MPHSRRRADSGKSRPKNAPNNKAPSPVRTKLSSSENFFDGADDHDEDVRGRSRRRNEGQRLIYASLPSTPTVSSPTFLQSPSPEKHVAYAEDSTPFSLWDYLREELLATDFDSHQELKWDRVSNFLSIPWAIEKVTAHLLLFDHAAHFNTADHRIRLHPLPRLLPVYLHDHAHPICRRYVQSLLEPHHLLVNPVAAVAKGRHTAYAAPRHIRGRSAASNRRQVRAPLVFAFGAQAERRSARSITSFVVKTPSSSTSSSMLLRYDQLAQVGLY
jgi:hypothetical protein